MHFECKKYLLLLSLKKSVYIYTYLFKYKSNFVASASVWRDHYGGHLRIQTIHYADCAALSAHRLLRELSPARRVTHAPAPLSMREQLAGFHFMAIYDFIDNYITFLS